MNLQTEKLSKEQTSISLENVTIKYGKYDAVFYSYQILFIEKTNLFRHFI